MNELLFDDLRFVVSRLPKDITKLMTERGLILGGGFVRAIIAGEKPSDIDLFGATKDQLEAAARKIADERKGARFHESKNAFTVLSGSRYPVQFITRWLFDDPKACMDSFDFTVAQAVIWFDGKVWKSCCSPRFYQDLAAKRLFYTSPKRNEDAGGSMLRVRKFLSRAGYNIQAPSLAAVMARIFAAVEVDNIKDEPAVATIISGLLREVDPLVAVDGFDLVDEHQLIKQQSDED